VRGSGKERGEEGALSGRGEIVKYGVLSFFFFNPLDHSIVLLTIVTGWRVVLSGSGSDSGFFVSA
jgi:hypothetical protein